MGGTSASIYFWTLFAATRRTRAHTGAAQVFVVVRTASAQGRAAGAARFEWARPALSRTSSLPSPCLRSKLTLPDGSTMTRQQRPIKAVDAASSNELRAASSGTTRSSRGGGRVARMLKVGVAINYQLRQRVHQSRRSALWWRGVGDADGRMEKKTVLTRP